MATSITSLPPVRSKSARPLTSARDGEALFHRWQKLHDRTARDELVQRFLPLARKLARFVHNVGHEPFDDLLQVASLGLVKAVDRF